MARSAVVSGSLGAGKTMLLRTLAEQQGESGLAIKVNLVSTLQDRITPTTPVRMVDRAGAPTDVGRLVQRKSAALIALRMAVKVRKEAVPIAETINSMLPPTHRILHRTISYKQLRNHQAVVEEIRIDEFSGLGAADSSLRNFTNDQMELARHAGRGLTLYFDRAEFFTPLELTPVLALLRKSEGYRVYVSMRPGTRLALPGVAQSQVVAGDDFDLIHLGSEPRSDQYQAFAHEVLERQVPRYLEMIDEDAMDLIRCVSRDSLRYRIKFVSAYRNGSRKGGSARAKESLLGAISDERRQLISSVRGNMRGFLPDFVGQLLEVADKSRHGTGRWTGPVELGPVYTSGGRGLLPGTTSYEDMITHALRHAGLVVAAGETWNPQAPAEALEIPPLLMWKPGDTAFPMQAPATRYFETEHQFAAQARKRTTEYKIFVGYNFDRQASEAFCGRLEDALNLVEGEDSYSVVTGKGVQPGRQWAAEIRKRLKSTKSTVVDLSNCNKDVLFEAGLAAGMARPIIPVIEDKSIHLDGLPKWLKRIQVAEYRTNDGFISIVDSAVEAARDRRRAGIIWPQPERMSTSRVAFVGVLSQLDIAQNKAASQEAELQPAILTFQDDVQLDADLAEFLKVASSAGLMIAVFGGAQFDWFLNFLLGYLVSAPGANPVRKMLCLGQGTGQPGIDRVAAAALRAPGVEYRNADEFELSRELRKYATGRAAEARKLSQRKSLRNTDQPKDAPSEQMTFGDNLSEADQ